MSGPAVSPAMFGARQAQPLSNFTADAKSILNGLFTAPNANDLPPIARAAIEQTERIRAIAARLLNSSEGEELLEALCDATMRRPVFITQMGMPSDQVLAMGQFREGMAATVYLLLAWMAEGKREQIPTRENPNGQGKRRARRASNPKRKRK